MTKKMALILIVFNFLSTASWANSCLAFLKSDLGLNSGTVETYTDPGVRFSITRSSKINSPISETALTLKPVSQELAREKLGATDPRLDSVLTTLEAQGRLYGINTPSLTGYLRSLSHQNLRETHPVQFIFWEGQGSKIETHTTVKGTLMDIQPVMGKVTASNKVEAIDHIALTIRETNSLGEQINTIVRIPMMITGEKYITLTPPRQNLQGEFTGYHWGLLLGTDIVSSSSN